MRTPSLLCLQILRDIACPPSRQIWIPHASRRCYATPPNPPRSKIASAKPPPPRPLPNTRPPISEPGFQIRKKSDDDEDFIPQPLSRPIGMSYPPRPRQNMGIDRRSLKQRRDDFVDYDKHLERRAIMTKQIAKPYFRDWSNLRFHKGKIFKCNERLFRADASLWFPNFYGQTLRKDVVKADRKDGYGGLGKDTCLAMHGKVSVVSLVSNTWASNQVDTFCSPEQNPELHKVLREGNDVAQMVWINYENNNLKWWLLQLFKSSLRKVRTQEEQSRYFMVRRGFNDTMKEAIGVLNEKAGYVYLVDYEGRIRWAGSADAEPEERESMVRGLQRLILEARTPQEERVDHRQQLLDAVTDITDTSKVAGSAVG